MTTNYLGDLVCTKEEYKILKETLKGIGVNIIWSLTDGEIYECYVRNPWKEAGQGWGSDLVKGQAKEFFDRYNK